MTDSREQPATGIGLRWFESLQVKLGLMFLILLMLLGAASFYASQRLVGGGLDAASFRYETEVSRRLSSQIEGMTASAKNLADLLVLIASDTRIAKPLQKTTIESAADGIGRDSAILSFGVWPEPLSTAPGTPRSSLVWVRDAGNQWALRADYNDRDTIPYWREAWYTPARLVTGDQCYWSPRYRDPLTKRDVVSCVRPLLGARGFEGAVTVTLDLDALAMRFEALTAEDSGYALLVDRDGQSLALSRLAKARLGGALAPGRNIAELAQKQPLLNPLVLAIHARNEAFSADALRSSLYDAKQVSALKDNTRDLARTDADSILAAIWNHAVKRPPAALQTLRQPQDPVLDETGYAALAALPGTDWQLASVTPTREGQDSARYLITQALVITLGAVALTLLIAFIVLRASAIRPLRRMLQQLDGASKAPGSLPVTLDQSANNEIGALAHWFNERGGQLRELNERANAAIGQLAMESAERKRAQDALTRVQERSHLALTTIDDGVVTIDERGHIEDMNPVAEQLLGVNLRAVRGTPFAQSFQARLGGEAGAALPNPAELVLERGSRIEYPDGVFLGGKDLAEREIYLAVAPLRSRNGKSMGCVVVLRRLASRLPGSTAAVEQLDPVTGLSGRYACERRVRHLLDSARIGVRQHALLMIEVRSRKAEAGTQPGDLLQTRLAELFSALAGSSEQVFSLPGGRFAMTLEQVDTAQSQSRAQTLIEKVAQTREQGDRDEESLSATVGICPIDASLDNAAEGIRRAGIACDAGLRAGNGACFYQTEQDQAGVATDDPLWVQRIRRGLDHNQFHVTTQWLAPARSRLAEGSVFEVLVSLEDEEGFWASAESFLPAAERHQLAGEIDRWVIARVLETLSTNAAGLCARIAFCGIGLSSLSMADPTFLDFLAEQLNSHPRVPVDKLCFELRDDLVISHPQQAQRFCEALHAFGCRISIDQRSSRPLANADLMRRLPLAFLKLDAQQFRRIADDPVEQTLAEASLRLAQLLRQRIIVTQIDTDELATIWKRLGADYLQGLAIAKPSPVPFTGV